MKGYNILYRVLDAFARPLLLRFDPERAHEFALWAIPKLPLPGAREDDPRLAVRALGLCFQNPLGFAAGFDKNGEIIDSILRLGFGFTEVGTVTPSPQAGNPRPRIFRLPREEGAINRLGFPNKGHALVHARLAARSRTIGIIGINIGANKDSLNRAGDYVQGIKTFADVASYFTINVSSPNTPGLRELQRPAALDDLLARVLAARDETALRFGRKPVLLKIAPDLTLGELDSIVACARKRKIDGMIVSNTTIARPVSLADPAASEPGGLSGRPLFGLSTQMLAAAYLRAENQFPLIGTGGVDSAKSALAKIEAGATLVQICTAFVFKGLTIAGEIKQGLLRLIEQKSYPRIADAAGAAAADWASGKLNADNFR
ncbi:MAG: quinone-dependent dihydroorotate dehydrogenase [Beijerinckiaceae bacterium]|nr:quinone-dependent dihydroorotate dehydrogenase [Beijerinckiaceae bacterium]